ncbi:T-cell receptor alpha chain V region 2B4 [Microtus ochrogaster]|nr:T-cell receptor alpha chain V region 2B4 [Microtus ochrogaster]
MTQNLSCFCRCSRAEVNQQGAVLRGYNLRKERERPPEGRVPLAASGRLQEAPIQGVRGVEVEQSPSALSLQEGKSSTLLCNFSTTMTNVQWFRQNPRGSIINLFYLNPGTKENGRLNSTFVSKERYSTLQIRDAQLEDSGTYLCAAYAQ